MFLYENFRKIQITTDTDEITTTVRDNLYIRKLYMIT